VGRYTCAAAMTAKEAEEEADQEAEDPEQDPVETEDAQYPTHGSDQKASVCDGVKLMAESKHRSAYSDSSTAAFLGAEGPASASASASAPSGELSSSRARFLPWRFGVAGGVTSMKGLACTT